MGTKYCRPGIVNIGPFATHAIGEGYVTSKPLRLILLRALNQCVGRETATLQVFAGVHAREIFSRIKAMEFPLGVDLAQILPRSLSGYTSIRLATKLPRTFPSTPFVKVLEYGRKVLPR